MNNTSKMLPWSNMDSEMSFLMGRLNWSDTLFGLPSDWSSELSTVVSLMLQSSSPTAIVWGDTLETVYNDAYSILLGDKHPSLLGSSFNAIWSEIWPEIKPFIEQAMAGNPLSLEDTPYLLEKNGVVRQKWYSSSFSPIKSKEGVTRGLYITSVETTKKIEVEHHYAFQSELTNSLRDLNTSDDIAATASKLLGMHLDVGGVTYAAVDDSGEILTMKPDWTNGLSRSLAGAVLRLDDFGPLVGEAVRAGENLVIFDVTTDKRSADYTAAYAERGVRSFVSIPLMKGGRLRAILNLHDFRPHYWSEHEILLAKEMVNSTWLAIENSRAQSELIQERDQSRYVFETMTEGFGLVDKDWNVVYMNPAGLQITQRAAHEVIGKNHWDIWPELVGTIVGNIFEQVKITRVPEVVEVPYTVFDMECRYIESHAYPSLNGGLAFFFRDITERKAAQIKLIDADRRKDEFLAMLAHELRNPLAPISSAAELLQSSKLNEESTRRTSQIISRQVRHMTSLVDDLLDVSRVTRGLVTLDKKPLNINRIISDAVEQVTPLIRDRHHRLELHLTPDAALVLGDSKRLVQVLANVLNNAAKYTNEGGAIQLRTDVRNSQVHIVVSDNGIGMAPELAARAFDLFAQAERSSDRSLGGLGLGLALVKSLVELHHGTVKCESDGLGMGSKFIICLPLNLRLDEEVDLNFRSATGGVLRRLSNLKIMVVDDNVDGAAMLAMLLEASGHQVVVEHDAYSALDKAKEVAPHVCLLDIGLPEMNGYELARRLRARAATAQPILIAVTGYGQDSDKKLSAEAGFDHHLVKPLNIKELTDILDIVSTS